MCLRTRDTKYNMRNLPSIAVSIDVTSEQVIAAVKICRVRVRKIEKRDSWCRAFLSLYPSDAVRRGPSGLRLFSREMCNR